MEFKGTKGKWEINRWGNVRSENGTEVAYMPSLTVKEQKEANALLISKAPEMLEMLQLWCTDMEERGRAYGDCYTMTKELIKEATTL